MPYPAGHQFFFYIVESTFETIAFFSSFTIFFSTRISVLVFLYLMVAVSLSNFFVLFMHCFPHFIWLSVFSCSSLNFLQRIILNYLSYLHFFMVSYQSFISFLWWSHIYLIFLFSLFLILVSVLLHNRTSLPDFTVFLWKKEFFTSHLSFWVCLLIMLSGRWGLLLWSTFDQGN